MKYINKIIDFLLCFLLDKCVYSSKKLIGFIILFLIIYLEIFTMKSTGELLILLAAILGLRSYDVKTSNTNNGTASNTNNVPNEDKG